MVVVGAGVSISASRDPNRKTNTASWTGLLLSGVEACLRVRPELDETWAQRVRADINSNDIDDLLSAAQKIETKLGGPSGGNFVEWLYDRVGSLRVTHPDVPEALRELGLPILTTNYDNILEEATGLDRLTWREGPFVEQVLRGERKAVVHLHGHYMQPDTIILGIRSYEDLLRAPHTQALQRALMTLKTLLFVGFGAGSQDPNFDAWLKWRRHALGSSMYPAFRLACGVTQAKAFQAHHPPEDRVRVLSYSDRGSFDDLAPFLRSLLPEGKPRGKA